MIYPKFTFSEIINGSVIRNDEHREKVISFLRSFIKYLKTVKKLSDNSTKMYINKTMMSQWCQSKACPYSMTPFI